MTDMHAPSQPSLPPGFAVILVEPQLGENIGMVSRAMWNCGLSDLRLVAPRDGWPNQAAIDAASGATVPIDAARVFPDVASACADLKVVYASSDRVREMQSRVMTPEAAAREIRGFQAQATTTGILFGPERTGLFNDDIARASALIRIPTNPAFTSLNLAQAVLLIGYAWWSLGVEEPADYVSLGETEPATRAEFEGFFARMVTGLEQGYFFRSPRLKPHTLRSLRTLFERARLSAQEVRTMNGVVNALRRAGPYRFDGRI